MNIEGLVLKMGSKLKILTGMRFFAIFLVSAFFSASAIAQTNAANTYFGAAPRRAELFDKYVRQIEDSGVINSVAIEKRLGSSLAQELAVAKKLFISASTKDDVYYALLALRNAFHDAHSRLIVGRELELKGKKSVELPFSTFVLEREGTFQYFVGTSDTPELPKGSRILAIDGVSTADLWKSNRAWFESSSREFLALQTAEWLSSLKPRKLPSKIPGDKSEIEFLDPSGEQKKLVLSWGEPQKRVGKPDACVVDAQRYSLEYVNADPIFRGINFCAYKFPNDTLLIRYFSFAYDFSPDEIWNRIGLLSFKPGKFDGTGEFSAYLEKEDQSQLKDLIRNKQHKLIVLDVRENGGGNISPNLIALFARDKFQVLKRQMFFSKEMRKSSSFYEQAVSMADSNMIPLISEDLKIKANRSSRLLPFFCQTKNCFEDEVYYSPDLSVPKAKLVLLTGPFCMSSCDQFAAILQDNQIAKIAGLSPRGGHSPFRAEVKLKLRDGSTFGIVITTGLGYRPNGTSLDGNPAIPDLPIWPDGTEINSTVEKISESFVK